MSTAEMSMATNTARALIDARLEAVERALFGRLSRAERLDIVGEIESRIDELIHERCGQGNEPTREDVLAVLAKLDPPEAYFDFESGDAVRQKPFEKPVGRMRSETGVTNADAKLVRRSLIGGVCGIVGFVMALMAPVSILIANSANSDMMFLFGFGGSLLACLTAGTAALVFSSLGKLKSP